MCEKDRNACVALGLVFLLSRAAVYAAGLRFDASPLATYWQYLDPLLLETDLSRSLLYLHSQPPLYNLFLGLVLKLSPVDVSSILHLVYLLAGWTCCWSTFFVMRRLGVAAGWALATCTVLVVRPSFLLFENHLIYDVPMAALLSLAAVWLTLFAERQRPVFAHAFFFTLLAVCATRSLFHPIYFVVVLVILAVYLPRARPQLARAAVVPGILLLALLLKNLVFFGQFGTSTWLGMNLWRIASTELSDRELARLEESGELSAVAPIQPFSRLEDYPAAYSRTPERPDIPALAAPRRSTGAVNFNHEAYIGIARSYFRDSTWILGHRPADYLLGMAKAWYYYLTPQTRILNLQAQRDQIAGYARCEELVLYGELPSGFRFKARERPIYLFSLVTIPALLAYALRLSFRRDAAVAAPARRTVLAFLTFTTLFVALVGNSLEVFENQRFRFMTDPFLAVFLALALARIGAILPRPLPPPRRSARACAIGRPR